jgi:hypothetical protein
MKDVLHNIIAKHVKSEFEYDWQPDESTNRMDWNYYWSFPQPGEDVRHYTDYHEDEPYEPLDKVVNRDDYPEETGGQGELSTVDYWTDTGIHYYILEPSFDNGSHGLENYTFYKDYLDV